MIVLGDESVYWVAFLLAAPLVVLRLVYRMDVDRVACLTMRLAVLGLGLR